MNDMTQILDKLIAATERAVKAEALAKDLDEQLQNEIAARQDLDTEIEELRKAHEKQLFDRENELINLRAKLAEFEGSKQRYKRSTEAEIAEIKHLAAAGKNCHQIGQAVGRHRQTVAVMAKRLGISVPMGTKFGTSGKRGRCTYRSFSEADKAELARRAANNEILFHIAKAMNRSSSVIERYAKKAGLTLAKGARWGGHPQGAKNAGGDAKPAPVVAPPDAGHLDIRKIRSLIALNQTAEQIAGVLGCDVEKVRAFAAELEVAAAKSNGASGETNEATKP